MLQVSDLFYSIGDQKLISGINWSLQPQKRVALIGPNGSGKTTLLRILIGEIEPHKGMIAKPRHYCIGYLPQEEVVVGEGTVLENALAGKPEVLELEQKIQALHSGLDLNEGDQKKNLKRLGVLEQRYQNLGGYSLEAEAKKILSGLGFLKSQFPDPFSELSGGWCMRIYLARLLLQEPDLLLLDEPTNHLDIPSMEWLEQYLVKFKGSVVIVSHDRFFIDRVSQELYELDRGKLTRYRGNYRFYEKQKEQSMQLLVKRREEQITERERIQRFINRYRSDKKRASQVQSRIRMLEKLERIELPPLPRRLDFHLSVETPSYKDVLTIENMSFRYGKEWVLKDIHLQISREERMAMVGVNGTGKTTLTRLITGELSPEQGTVKVGSRVNIGYYAQHQINALNLDSTVYDEVASTVADGLVPRIRAVLGMFQFNEEDILKKIKVLSGGEKARVSLAKILLSPVNFLIMDEPTTHLDITAREALEDALFHYNGTLLLISHDRYFLDKLVGRTIELKNSELIEYWGNYSYYIWKRYRRPDTPGYQEEEEGRTRPVSGKKTKEQKRMEAEARQAVSNKRRRLQKSVDSFEKDIKIAESEKLKIETVLAWPVTYRNGSDVKALHVAHADLKKRIDALYDRWEQEKLKLKELINKIN